MVLVAAQAVRRVVGAVEKVAVLAVAAQAVEVLVLEVMVSGGQCWVAAVAQQSCGTRRSGGGCKRCG